METLLQSAKVAYSAIAKSSGVAAHSGGFFEDGRSAIEELARKVQALHALTDFDRGITINVGLIAGGQSVNTVAAEASCGIDIRYRDSDDRAEIFEKVRKFVRRQVLMAPAQTWLSKANFIR